MGLFIARISRGRTLREFVLGVMFIPLGFIFAWFSIFGNSAIELVSHGATALGETALADPAMGMFALFEHYPFAATWSLFAVLIGLIFFVTSADSGALVLANLSSKNLASGADAPIWLRLFWAAATGLITLGLLFAGGFSSLQSVSVVAGLPFSLVLVVYMVSMWKSLRQEGNKRKANAVDKAMVLDDGRNWRNRLNRLVSFPGAKTALRFMVKTLPPAMLEVAHELQAKGIDSTLAQDKQNHRLRLEILHGEEVDFVYDVPSADVERLKSDEKFEVKEITSVENFFLGINLEKEPFNDVNVRQAINYGINREDVIAAALNGYGASNYTAIAMGYEGDTDAGAAVYDLDKAKEYLDKWGGDPSSIVLPIICSNETKVAVATVIQSNLSKLGIQVEVVSTDTATYFADWEAGNYTGLISSWSPSNSLTYVQRYHSDRALTYPGSLKDEEVDKMVRDAESTIDDTERIGKIKTIVETVNGLAPQISLYQPLMFRAYSADLGGVTASATGYVGFNDMYWK